MDRLTLHPQFVAPPLIAILLLSAGCKTTAVDVERPAATHTEPPASPISAGTVEFGLKPLPADGSGVQRWQAIYTNNGKTASFRFELGSGKTIDSGNDSFALRSGKGKFLADAGSDSTALIANLKKALGAKHQPTKVKRVQSLPFTYVSFEEHESLSADGGFSLTPLGNWTPMKIFLGGEKDDIELFLNIDSVDGKGQFSIKDADYGDDAVRLLARVL